MGECHEGTAKAERLPRQSPPWEIPETQMGMSSVMFGHSRGKHGQGICLSLFPLDAWGGAVVSAAPGH